METEIKAEFTQFDSRSNLVKGKVNQYTFEAKLFDEGSTSGINNGRVSKLAIFDEVIRQEKQDFFASCIVNYYRGWDIKPKKENKPYFDKVMELLENSPKRF